MDPTLKRGGIALIVFVVVLIVLSFLQQTQLVSIEGLKDVTGAVLGPQKQDKQDKIPVEHTNSSLFILFCPQDHCAQQLADLIKKAQDVDCAFFELNKPEVIRALEEKGKNHARVVVDNENKKLNTTLSLVVDNKNQYMHHKFCILNKRIVWTGSFNPTESEDKRNNNNVMVLESSVLVKNYQEEFDQLWNKQFGVKKKQKTPFSTLLWNNISMENYFCPQDDCANEIIDELKKAQKSIVFMTFSFTHNEIGDVLIDKKKAGLDIRGIMEKRQLSEYSEAERLRKVGISVMEDKNPGTMHHKVFIMDNRTVITGSMNPTKRGDAVNDENVVIIHDSQIAGLFLEEFERLRE